MIDLPYNRITPQRFDTHLSAPPHSIDLFQGYRVEINNKSYVVDDTAKIEKYCNVCKHSTDQKIVCQTNFIRHISENYRLCCTACCELTSPSQIESISLPCIACKNVCLHKMIIDSNNYMYLTFILCF